MTATGHGVVVGVTGPGENTPALVVAAQEARLLHVPVTLVHAVPVRMPPPPPSILMTATPMLAVGQEVGLEVAEEFTSLGSSAIEPTVIVRQGRPASILVELSETADLVVLAHRHLPHVKRLVTGSTVVSVATHAACPVISVPETWAPATGVENGRPGVITVGVHESGTTTRLLQTAFEVAAAHRCSLRLLHAWRLDAAYDDLVVRRIDPDWAVRASDDVQGAVTSVAVGFPDVPFEVGVEHQWPADALTAASATSDLVIVGRHGHDLHLPARLGSVARTVLRTAVCPVMVVPV